MTGNRKIYCIAAIVIALAFFVACNRTLEGTPMGATNFHEMQVLGRADNTELLVRGYTTQTTYPLIVEQSDGSDVFDVTNAGIVRASSTGVFNALIISSTSELNGDITLENDETLSNVTDGIVTATVPANGWLAVAGGNLKVGNGTPDTTLNGEDLYVEGTLEVDAASRFDNVMDVNSTASFDYAVVAGWLDVTGAITGASTLDIAGNVSSATGAFTITDDLNVTGAADLDSTLNVDGAATVNSLDVDAGNITLQNDETIANSTDGEVRVTCDNFVAGGGHTVSTPNAGTMVGGDTNTTNAKWSFIGGGYSNAITVTTPNDDSRYSVLCGGNDNEITATDDEQSLVGGYSNSIGGDAAHTFLGGGYDNGIAGTSNSGVLVGGATNVVTGSWASVLGGLSNVAGADYAVALGRRATVYDEGSFAFADSTDADFTAVTSKTFNVRATNGSYFGTGGLHAYVDAVAKTSDYNVDDNTDTGGLFTNQGASGGGVRFTLPGAVEGLNYCFYVFATNMITVDVQSGDQIHHLTNSAGDCITNTTEGDSIYVYAIDGTYWVPMQEVGTWNDGNGG